MIHASMNYECFSLVFYCRYSSCRFCGKWKVLFLRSLSFPFLKGDTSEIHKLFLTRFHVLIMFETCRVRLTLKRNNRSYDTIDENKKKTKETWKDSAARNGEFTFASSSSAVCSFLSFSFFPLIEQFPKLTVWLKVYAEKRKTKSNYLVCFVF